MEIPLLYCVNGNVKMIYVLDNMKVSDVVSAVGDREGYTSPFWLASEELREKYLNMIISFRILLV